MERIRSGDREAFRDIVDTYKTQVYRLAYSVLKHPKDAEDAAQEAFVKVYLSLPQYEGQGLKTWISRIALNHAIDVKRKRARSREELKDTLEDEGQLAPAGHAAGAGGSPVELAFERGEKAAVLAERLGELPENYRGVIHAYYIREQSYQEIAAEQGVELKTVESKLYRARKWIREHWKEEDFR
ncbi:sigma-70 family RNA polymerase sigma factor [Paenibacillus gansuensis]|uniref:Sigma-70 family RNA polymerase sigma factor n=1 Tax=Paenibacillus gansuensis TaxID=306542 RepID=A0ABW5PHD3_9BACL